MFQPSWDEAYDDDLSGRLPRVVARGRHHEHDQPGDEAEASDCGEDARPPLRGDLLARDVERGAGHFPLFLWLTFGRCGCGTNGRDRSLALIPSARPHVAVGPEAERDDFSTPVELDAERGGRLRGGGS